jgi:hypothetical protein
MGLDLKPLKLRLIRVDLPTGETEILIRLTEINKSSFYAFT